MNKLINLLFLGASVASGQQGTCYVGGTTTGCPCAAGQNPCVQQYIQSFSSTVAALQATSGFPGSAIPVSTNLTVASPGYRDQDGVNCNNSSSIFSTATGNSNSIGLNKYIDYAIGSAAQVGQGVSVLIYNYNPVFYMEAPQYATYCAGNICGTPSSPSLATCQLGVDLAFIQHAVGKGLKIYLSAAPEGNTWTSCGLTPGNATSMSVANVNACLNPVEQTVIAYYAANSITVTLNNAEHEPTGQFQSGTGITYTEAQYTAIINSTCAAVFSVSSSVLCGGGFSFGDSTYISNFISNYGSHVQFIGLENYALTAGYTTMMTTIASDCVTAKAAGLQCHNTEGNPPVDSPAGVGGEQNAYYGCAAPFWQTYGLNDQYALTVPKFLATSGFSSATRFATQPFIGFDPTTTNNCSPSSGSSSYIMANSVGSTAAQSSWQAGATWNGVVLKSPTLVSVTIK